MGKKKVKQIGVCNPVIGKRYDYGGFSNVLLVSHNEVNDEVTLEDRFGNQKNVYMRLFKRWASEIENDDYVTITILKEKAKELGLI